MSRASRAIRAVVFAACAATAAACTRETSRGPVAWTASNPASPTGQTDAQAWSRSTSNDSTLPAGKTVATPCASPRGTEVERVERLELPPQASLRAAERVGEVRPFPDELRQRAFDTALDTPVTTGGTDRIYETPLPYGDVVDFFAGTLSTSCFQDRRQTTTSTATIFSARGCGELAHVAVRDTRPTTIEVMEAGPRVERGPTGVAAPQGKGP